MLICALASHDCITEDEVLLPGGNLTFSSEVHTVLIAFYHFPPMPGFAVVKIDRWLLENECLDFLIIILKVCNEKSLRERRSVGNTSLTCS